MKEFNRDTVKQFRELLNKHLQTFEEETGVRVELGNIRFTSMSLTSKVSATILKNGSTEEADRIKFDRDSFKVGCSRDLYGKQFRWEGVLYKVTGIKTRSRKYPLICEDVEYGLQYKFPVHLVENNLVVEEVING